ncbi:MAG TPA: hypothetical protein VF247_10530, partial [Candidatus Krumholzibacteria bacterium]
LDLVIPGFGYPSSSLVDGDKKYFAPDGSAPVFNTPHSVPKPDVGVFDVAPATIALSISSPYPANVELLASTGKNCPIICYANDLWAMANFRTSNTDGQPVSYLFWGFTGPPADLNAEGGELLGNMMYLLDPP